MTTLANFANPISVIQRSPTSGVFGSNQFVGDKEGFVQKVIGKWYCTPWNTIPVESMSHWSRRRNSMTSTSSISK